MRMMPANLRPGWYFLILCLYLLPCTNALALRCDNGLIDEGDRRLKVRQACGEPTWINNQAHAHAGSLTHSQLNDVEEWYYNFGPNRLVQVLIFRNNRLSQIQSAGYGYTEGYPGSCNSSDIITGMSQLELVVRCGQPADRELHYRNVTRYYPQYQTGSLIYPIHQYVEEWTYNFGHNKFLRHVTLLDGRIIHVETGERGYR